MDFNQKKTRLKNIINKLEDIMENDYMNVILDEKDLKLLEIILRIKPYSKKHSQQVGKSIKRISGNGLKRKKSKASVTDASQNR